MWWPGAGGEERRQSAAGEAGRRRTVVRKHRRPPLTGEKSHSCGGALPGLLLFCALCVFVPHSAGLCETWARPKRARSRPPTSSCSSESPSPASLSPAQVPRHENTHGDTKRQTAAHCRWPELSHSVCVSVFLPSDRRQRLGEPKHVVQLQRRLHQLLRHQALSYPALWPEVASRGSPCCTVSVALHRKLFFCFFFVFFIRC